MAGLAAQALPAHLAACTRSEQGARGSSRRRGVYRSEISKWQHPAAVVPPGSHLDPGSGGMRTPMAPAPSGGHELTLTVPKVEGRGGRCGAVGNGGRAPGDARRLCLRRGVSVAVEVAACRLKGGRGAQSEGSWGSL